MSRDYNLIMLSCKICSCEFESAKKLTNHVNKAHKLTSEDYTDVYVYDSNRPKCPICGKNTRYSSLTFKKYCIEHSYIAESESGKVGGKIKTTWNKGASKQSDHRIAALAMKNSGSGNPFYGRSHSQETIRMIADTKRLSSIEVQRRIHENVPNVSALTDF